jgi:Reverse transcriptase (RNA-dependent DNA polymerase)
MYAKWMLINAKISEDIWVQLPKGSRPGGDTDDGVYKLKKSLYGLKQAPREWNKCINEFLTSIDSLVALYVDDL